MPLQLLLNLPAEPYHSPQCDSITVCVGTVGVCDVLKLQASWTLLA